MGLELPLSDICLPQSLLSLAHFWKDAKTAAGMGSGSLTGRSRSVLTVASIRSSENWVTGFASAPGKHSVELARLSAELCLGAAARLQSKVAAFLSPGSVALC